MNGCGQQLAIGRWYEPIVGHLHPPEEDIEVHGDALEAEHVVSVGGDFDLELRWFFNTIDDWSLAFGSVFIQLQAELEA